MCARALIGMCYLREGLVGGRVVCAIGVHGLDTDLARIEERNLLYNVKYGKL